MLNRYQNMNSTTTQTRTKGFWKLLHWHSSANIGSVQTGLKVGHGIRPRPPRWTRVTVGLTRLWLPLPMSTFSKAVAKRV